MPYFNKDIWLVSDFDLPQYRMSNKVSKFDFSRLSNAYNKNVLKQFIYSQIRASSLSIDAVYEKYLTILRFLLWLGSKNFDRITFIDVENYAFSLNELNNTPGIYNKHISRSREFFDYLLMRGYSLENFFEKIKYKKFRYSCKLMDVDNEVLFEILSRLNKLPLKMQIMFLILYVGLRITYMLRLERDCLVTDNKIHKLKFYNPSARDYDYIIIPKNLYLLIEKYLKGLPEGTSKYLFPNSQDPNRPDADYMLKSSIRKLLNEAGYQGEKANFQLSYLRNNLMIRLFLKEVPLRIIQEVLKTNSLDTINIYHELFTNKNFELLKKHINTEIAPY